MSLNRIAIVFVAGLATGCGIVDLWERSREIDSGAVRETLCERGIQAVCNCRDLSKATCGEEEIDLWIERCEARAPGWTVFARCTEATIGKEGEIACEDVQRCGQIPQ
ncbi:MAG: hypothetical protein AAF602_25490 [Myxococcota bacterium]